ncbi:tetratricopeptide repeat protein [Tahibacter soli]|uniref:Tetratricopeptide repeat protein n=1 Tax=Tahibacter soli TaxID=2983605 RepID=A0A9X3YKC5_9GAMM|nr:tetratricopeptide repeat protein [Tahibacter soli]MDC8013204.1 tetratricopeptide repeat protein [Tahibacter soli]
MPRPTRPLALATFGLCALLASAAGAQTATLDACRSATKSAANDALAICLAAHDAALAARDARTAADALVERADANVALARYDDATADLDRAGALLAPFADWRDAHRIERRRGIVAYRRERLAEAALSFGKALDMARAHDDAAAQAQSWNDVGNAYRRVGDYAQALEAFTTSLALREKLGQSAEAAAVLNNLGNVQQDLGDYAAAEDWLQRALAAYRAQASPRQVAHVLESLALNDRRRQRDDAARAKLEAAWSEFAGQRAARDQLRVATHLARLEAELGRNDAANAWIARALDIGTSLKQSPTLALLLAQARAQTAAGEASPARQALRARLASGDGDAIADRVEAWRFLAQASERGGDAERAVADLKQAQAATVEEATRTQNERIAQWQVRLDVAEKVKEIAALRETNRAQARTLADEGSRWRLRLGAALALFAIVAGALVVRVRRQRARLEAQIARYRDAAEALRTDAAAPPDEAADDAANAPGEAPPADTVAPADTFRRALVELMVASVHAWERSTRTSPVEFAEKSGIWRVHIDDGRLRMRSMERYLSLAKLPRQPRWREVLRSAYFVLAECPLEAAERTRLEALVAGVREALKARAMG